MQKILNKIFFLSIVVFGVIACAKNEFGNVVDPNQIVIYATTNNPTQTKIIFEDQNLQNIALSWEESDTFTIYEETGNLVGNFKCTDAELGKFLPDNAATLTDGTKYIAIYPASTQQTLSQARSDINLSEQNGDKISNLNAACKMEGEFTFAQGQNITLNFEHKMAIMTFIFQSETKPAKLIFENGDTQYAVLYESIEAEDNIYTSHIMVEPCDATNRTLVFSLYEADQIEPYDRRAIQTNKPYLSGCRYTAPISNLEQIIWQGSGSEANPYQISSAKQLSLLADKVNAGESYSNVYFVLTDNIDMIDREFKAIGSRTWIDDRDASDGLPFSGSFDGGDNTIVGLNINESDMSTQGVFGYTKDAVIKNLKVSGCIKAVYNAGGVVGYSESSTITNCHNNATVDVAYQKQGGIAIGVGGIAGYASRTTIANCSSTAKLTATANHIGGIVGWNSYSTVESCYNTGAILGESVENIGGVVGGNYHCSISNCYNKLFMANITASSATNVGGLVGANLSNSSISNSYSIAMINATPCEATGGILGYNDAGIANSYYNNHLYKNGEAIGVYGQCSEMEAIGGLDNSAMQAGNFVTLLNAGQEPKPWAYDNLGQNNGYPILNCK